jgi:hypothetical protein
MKKGKMYFVNTMAAVVMGLAVTSCSDDDLFTEQDALKNANKVLGVEIAANHDWKMSSAVSTAITINLDYDETYDITVYSNDPLTNEYGTVLTQGTVKSGETFVRSFEYPKALTSLFVGVRDSHGHTFYRTAPVADGKLSMTVGTPAVASARGMFKSSTAPAVPDITIPDAAYAASFLNGAKEPTDENTVDNYDNGYDVPATEGHWVEGGSITITTYATAPGFRFTVDPSWGSFNNNADDLAFWNNTIVPLKAAYDNIQLENDSYNHTAEYIDTHKRKIDAYYAIVNALGESRKSWLSVWTQPVYPVYTGGERYWVDSTPASHVDDPTYAKKFKITGTYNKGINVLSTEQQYGDARTVYISGKWTLSDLPNGATEQRVGGGAVIVIDNGGELNIPAGKLMTFVNQARLVVMPGGKITGDGQIMVTNGNAEGLEGYNGGTIDIGTFNNNFGKFYNYGTFKCTNLKGGAGESNFYNHGVAHIVRSGVANANGGNYDTPNTRIFNACQFYCEEDMRAYIIEMTSGSYFKVGGELMMSTGNDGTNDDTYVALAAGAMMEVGSLWNNLTSWIGPTDGYAVLQAGGISYLNWDGNEPITKGYFINNIAVSVDDTTIGADPNGGNQGKAKGIDTYKAMRDCILNGYGSDVNNYGSAGKTASPNGNGGAVLVNKGCANMSVPADEGFTLGVAGCTPGYNPGTPPRKKVKAQIWSYAFEDSRRCDYDMNDVVLKVSYYQPDEYTIDSTKVDVTLCCTGASYNLTVWLNQNQILGQMEVHRALTGTAGKFINTGHDLSNDKFQQKAAVTIPLIKPQGFNIASADFWIKSPEGEVHVAKTSQDPHGVIIPGDWRWPLEWTCIKDAYPDFVEFAKDPSNPAYAGWYNNPATDKLY